MTKKKLFLLLGVGLLAVGLVTFFFKGSSKETVVDVKRGPAVEVVYATGTVEPVDMVNIAPETSGRLDQLLADDGQPVKAGEVLAVLDAREEQGAVDELAAKLRLNQIAVDRATALFAKKAGSQLVLDEAESTLKQTEAQLAQAKERLAKRSLVSPLDGMVLRKDGDVGELIAAGQQMFVVGDLARLRIELEVDEDDLPRIALGQKVLLTADAFPGKVFEATLSEITPWGDTTNKSYRVRAKLPEGVALKIGMTVEANIVVKEVQNALLVPTEAVKGSTVRVKGLTGASSREVTVGIRGPDFVEITEGLKEGEKVVAPGFTKPGLSLGQAATTVSNQVR